MNPGTIRLTEIRSAIEAACDRLVGPSVTEPNDRARQGRLMSVLLALPFPGSILAVTAIGPTGDIAAMLAAACGIFGLCWGMALALIWSHRYRTILYATVALAALATFALGAVFAWTSPAILAAGLIPYLAWRVFGIDRGAAVGSALALACLGAGSLAAAMAGHPPAGQSALHWLAPLAAGLLAMVTTPALQNPSPKAGEADIPAYLEGLDAAVFRIGPGGAVEAASAHTAEIFGLDPALLSGKGLFERVHVADRVAFLCAVTGAGDLAAQSRRPVLRIRVPGEDEASNRISLYKSFRCEVLATPDRPGVLLVARRAAEEEALTRQLAQAHAKMEEGEIAKGRFLAAVSHELRTPLNAIIGFSDVLLHPGISSPLQPKQAEQVGLIREAGGHLLDVVNAILDVSKIESGTYRITREPFSLREAVDFTCSMMKKEADEKRLHVSTRIPHPVGDVLADQRAVQQILINLLSNAIKFTPAGGTIRIAATRSGAGVSIRVSDTGIGIAQEDLDRLCQPFVQVQNDYTRQFQGTGLGLSLVKGLVGLHGGRLAIESAPGLGTAVTFTLPLATIDHERADEPARSPAIAAPTSEHTKSMQDDQQIQKIA